MNTIQPIQRLTAINSIGELNGASQAQSDSSVNIPFRSMFEDVLSNAQQTNANLDNEIGKLATGSTDNLHDALIASQKATMSIDMVVELRNKLLDAYKEVTSLSI